MQEHWGWDAAALSCTEANTRHWQAQWESLGDGGESSGWVTSNWDQPESNGTSHNEEFENIMQWDDSGALDAFETARKMNEEHLKGIILSVSLPSPDLYIQAVDWDNREDLNLPDPLGTLSPPRNGQRKRGRRTGGGYRRQFAPVESLHVCDRQQSIKPFLQIDHLKEGKAEPKKECFGSLGAPMLQGPSDSLPRLGPYPKLQSNKQDQTRSNWTSFYQKQSSDWNSHGRSTWNEPQDLQFHSSQQKWRPIRNQPDQLRGGHGGGPWHSHGLSTRPCSQPTPLAQGNDWMPRQETNEHSLTHQSPLFHFSSCARQQQAPSYVSDKIHRWGPPQHPNRRWL